MYRTWALAAAIFPSSIAFAQAWVPTELSLGVTLEYSFVFSSSDVYAEEFKAMPCGEGVTDPTCPDGRYVAAPVNSHVIIPTIDFTPYPNIGLKLALPFIASAWVGDFESTHPNPAENGLDTLPAEDQYEVDDGKRRFEIQDLQAELRYMIDIPDVITFAPHVGASFPLTDYPTVGHASVGRGRPHLKFGVSVGRALSDIIPGAYVQGRYQFSYVFKLKKDEFTLMEDPELSKLSINRSSGDLELGYFIFEDLSVRLVSHLELTHGGFQYFDRSQPEQVRFNHDVLGKEEYLLVGGGLTYILLDELFLSAAFLKWVAGKNTHDSDSINFAVSYTIF